MILSPEYTLFLSQLAKSKQCPISIHKVLHDCSKFQHHVPVAIGICNKGHKIKIQSLHLVLRLFPEYLGAEISTATQLQQQQDDVYELSKVV